MTDIKIEIWKELYEFERFYISNFGRVKKLTYFDRNKKVVETLITQHSINGVQICFIYHNKKRISLIIHREVAKAFVSNPNNFNYVTWKDRNKKNNHENNLVWIKNYNRSQNRNYKYGYENPRTKISQEQRKEIINKRKQGEKLDALAYEYNVSIATITRILKSK